MTVEDRAPTVTIASPRNAVAVTAGETLVVRGTSHDPDVTAPLPDDEVQWRWDDQTTPALTGHSGVLTTTGMTPGWHQLHLVGVPGGVERARRTVEVEVLTADPGVADPPVVFITSPTTGANLGVSVDGAGDFVAEVHLTAVAEDGTGTVLDGKAIWWRARTLDPTGSWAEIDLGVGDDLTVTLPTGTDCMRTFTIFATVTDGSGSTAEDRITVTTGVVC